MNTTSITKAKQILQHQLDILWDNPEKAEVVPPLMIWGPPGIGKSTFIRNLCKENNIGFIDVRLAQREPVDIRGLPVLGTTERESTGLCLLNGLVLMTRILQKRNHLVRRDYCSRQHASGRSRGVHSRPKTWSALRGAGGLVHCSCG